MKKLLSMALGAVMVSVVALSNVQATTATGQIEGGDIYKAKNVTQGDPTFVDPTDATCGDYVKLRVEIHNPGPVALKDVKVVAKLPSAAGKSHGSTVTVSASNANPASTSDSVTVKTDKVAKLSYVAGSAEYFNATGGREGSISDSIVTSGAELPNGVGVSFDHRRYVQFKVKFNCEETPESKTIKVCELSTKKVITIDEKEFDVKLHSTNMADCDETPVTPTELPRTGSEGVVAIVAALLTAGVAYAVTARRNVLG